MMFKSVLLGLFLLALTAVAQGPIDGVYYSDVPGSSSSCRIYAQIHLMNFMSYLGPCDSVNGQVLMGSYVIAPNAVTATSGVLSITYATKIPTSSGGPIAGITYSFVWSFMDAARTMLNITSVDPALEVSLVYIRNVATVMDGTWMFADQAGVNYILEAQANTYLSYTLNQGSGGPVTTMGTFELSPPNKIDVYLTYGAPGFEGTKENGTYAVTPTALNIVVTVEAANFATISLGPYSKVQNNNLLEGVWSGFTENPQGGYCLTTAEFHANLWRGYQTRCDPTYSFGFGTFLGTFDQFAGNAINLTYNFVDFHNTPNAPDLEGTTLTFGLSIGVGESGGPMSLTLTRNEGGLTTINLVKVETMPSQTIVDIRLQGNVTAFVGQVVTDFVNSLATLLGIDARNIRITGIRSGSVIVTVEIQDDLKADVSATAAPALIAQAASIGNFPVLGVTNVTPGATSSAVHTAASWLMVLALVCLAML